MSSVSTDQLNSLIERFEKIEPENLSIAQRSKYLYLKSFLTRLLNQNRVSERLFEKAAFQLHELERIQETIRDESKSMLMRLEYEDVYEEAKNLFEAEEFNRLKELYREHQAVPSKLTLSSLIKDIEVQSHHFGLISNLDGEGNEPNEDVSPRGQEELKSFRAYQHMFDKMALERLLARVMEEIPENAGPLNPERLVIRSFQVLQELAPSYLSSLIAYYESLLRLKQIGQER